MALYAVTIFVSAFLLFLVQPIMAKQILPWFGGSANVWTTCLVFFQTTLPLGYAYADLVVRRTSARTQIRVHVLLLALRRRGGSVGGNGAALRASVRLHAEVLGEPSGAI